MRSRGPAILGWWLRKRPGEPAGSSSRSTGGSACGSSPGADEAGRGPLAGPLVVAGVLLDLDCLRDHRVRPLAFLNDSKQCRAGAARGALPGRARVRRRACSVHVFPPAVIDRDGLHRSNLRGLREALWACQPAEVCLVDGFKLGPLAPPHRAVVDGDEKSAAIAAASIVAKVTRDRYMHAVDALLPGLRLRLARRLHHAVAQRRRPPDRAERDPPPLVPGALLPGDEPEVELVAAEA